MRIFSLFLLFLSFVLSGSAEKQQITGQDLFLPGIFPVNPSERGYLFNPAAFLLLDSSKSASVSLNYQAFGAESLHSLFEGDGGNRVVVAAAGYRVNPGKGIYSGAAAWETGINRNVKWTNVRDVEMLYPYLVADSLGGDYHHESYRLEGSWAGYAGRGIYGLKARYRGEVAFRLRDPRPRNTTSELELNPGAMWMFDNWYAGAFLKYTFYRQNLSTKIEEPHRKDRFYILTGMGLYDYRFSTVESVFDRYYRSHEYQVGVQMGQRKEGVSGTLSYSRRKMEVEEGDYRKPFLLLANRVDLALTWRKSAGHFSYTVMADGGGSWKNGTERSFEKVPTDQTTGAFIWRKLTESEKHRMSHIFGHLGGLILHTVSERQMWWYGADVHGQKETERYLLPLYKKELTDIRGEVKVGLRRTFGSKRFDAELRGGYKKNISSSLSAPDEQIVTRSMLLPEYEWGRRDYYTGQLRLEFNMPVYRRTSLAIFSDSRLARAGSDSRWQTEAGLRIEF